MNALTTHRLTDRPLIGPDSAGIAMTPEEYDALPPDEWERGFRYELIHGVLVVSPVPAESQQSPNDYLGHLLRVYQEGHPNGNSLDRTTFERRVKTTAGYRVCDRALWIGFGRAIKIHKDVPTIVVEFVSAGKRAFLRDYEEKRDEYLAAGVKEYWVIDWIQSQMTAYFSPPASADHRVIARTERIYTTPLLPGFELPLDKLLALAEEGNVAEEE
ncbi:MAG: Uma2 family endonuclease [Pirellulaceae bacterium]